MIDLSAVTLLTFTTRDYLAVRRSIDRCRAVAVFDKVVVFTDRPDLYQDCETVPIPRMTRPEQLNVVALATLTQYRHLYADHTLTIHWDSWIVRPEAWSDEWYKYDHLGAKWKDGVVGNDGFCLRSKHFWDKVAKLEIPPTVKACTPADVVVCRGTNRAKLEAAGMKYAPAAVADAFSVENREYVDSFGFHGTHTLLSLARQGLV